MIATLVAFATLGQLVVESGGVVFRYPEQPGVEKVFLAGSFNGWNRDATPMSKSSDGSGWTVRLKLEPGKHQYKFVLNGERWVVDPGSRRNEDDGNGNVNSVLVIMPPDYGASASRSDGRIASSALRHVQALPDLNVDRGVLQVGLRVRPGDLRKIELAVVGSAPVEMSERQTDELYARAVASVPWKGKPLRYAFRLRDGARVAYFGPKGLTGSLGGNAFAIDPAKFKPFEVPRWVEQTVLYQIFPDRFDNGDPANDPKDVRPWDAEPTWFNRFGGDVAGVMRRRSYLASLGVGCVYFNPVFQSPSNHRYDATDYLRIDREFGTNAEFAAMTRHLAAAGIRTVIDGVYNHTAVDFFAFKDLRERGAASAYRDWYFPKSFPIEVKDPPNYAAWFNFPSMPKLNLSNPKARAYMLDATAFWHRHAQISGWRLDVANEVEMDFWRAHRRKVKGIDPQAWIVGEVWGDGTPWLKGDQWDSVMNYRFREVALGLVARGTLAPSAAMERLMAIHEQHAPQVSRNLMNLLGSHDTPRFRTEAGGRADLAMLGATLQFGWIGAPSIYYGEEIGMEGGRDPENRRGMRWSDANVSNPILGHYQKLVAIRNASAELQSGDPMVLAADDARRWLAFGRVLGRSAAVVVLNRGEAAQTLDVPVGKVALVAEVRDALSGRRWPVRRGIARIDLGPASGAILFPPVHPVFSTLAKLPPIRSEAAPSQSVRKETHP